VFESGFNASLPSFLAGTFATSRCLCSCGCVEPSGAETLIMWRIFCSPWSTPAAAAGGLTTLQTDDFHRASIRSCIEARPQSVSGLAKRECVGVVNASTLPSAKLGCCVCVQATANFGLFARDIAQSRLRSYTYQLELDMRSSAMRDVLDEAKTEIVCRVHRH
jgi:hypothetical protein